MITTLQNFSICIIKNTIFFDFFQPLKYTLFHTQPLFGIFESGESITGGPLRQIPMFWQHRAGFLLSIFLFVEIIFFYKSV